MKKILFINACVREGSRTLRLAECVLKYLEGEVCERRLECEELLPLDRELLAKRERLTEAQDDSDPMFDLAKEFAASDTILVAAPYWDLMFPALLKLYLEQVTVYGLTFCYEGGIPKGLCRAKQLIYVMSAGGPVYYNLGYEYVKTLAQSFYGIEDVRLFQAENLDVQGMDVEAILQKEEEHIKQCFQNNK